MLREVEEAVQRNFLVAADGIDTIGVTNSWQSRLHISQVCDSSSSLLQFIEEMVNRSESPLGL